MYEMIQTINNRLNFQGCLGGSFGQDLDLISGLDLEFKSCVGLNIGCVA